MWYELLPKILNRSLTGGSVIPVLEYIGAMRTVVWHVSMNRGSRYS